MEYNNKFISPAIKVYCIQESEIHRHITALISLIEIKVNSKLPACEKLRNYLNLQRCQTRDSIGLFARDFDFLIL